MVEEVWVGGLVLGKFFNSFHVGIPKNPNPSHQFSIKLMSYSKRKEQTQRSLARGMVDLPSLKLTLQPLTVGGCCETVSFREGT